MLIFELPAAAVTVPTQEFVTPGVGATTKGAGRASSAAPLFVTLVYADAVGFWIRMVSVVVPPTWKLVGENDLVILIG